MRSVSAWFGSSLALPLLLVFALPSHAQDGGTNQSIAYDCDGGPGAGGFTMTAAYFLPAGKRVFAKATVTLDGKTMELRRERDDSAGRVFTSMEMELYRQDSGAKVVRGSKTSNCTVRSTAAPTSAQPAKPATSAAAAGAGQATPPPAKGPTSFYICIAMSKGVAYESAIFEASADAGTARRMYFQYAGFLTEKHGVSAMATCTPKPTRAAAQAYLRDFPAGVAGGVSRHVATGWVYSTGAPAAPP